MCDGAGRVHRSVPRHALLASHHSFVGHAVVWAAQQAEVVEESVIAPTRKPQLTPGVPRDPCQDFTAAIPFIIDIDHSLY